MRRSARWRRLLPGVDSLTRYERAWLRGDILAGLTVAAYLIPQCMAYAELAGLPAVVGLWAVLAPMTVYAIFGSSRQLSVGPESTTAVMTAAVLVPLAAGDPPLRRWPRRSRSWSACCACWAGCSGWVSSPTCCRVRSGRLHGRCRRDHDRRPTRQDDRRSGRGRHRRAQLASFVRELGDLHGPTVLLSSSVLVFLFVGAHCFPRRRSRCSS